MSESAGGKLWSNHFPTAHRSLAVEWNQGDFLMPTDLVLIGAILVVVAGGLIFWLINRQKPTEPPHFR